MGLAASQARFLCITARKADCEYKSTDLAQQKLNITNQLSAISNDYANSMNATKLMWANDTVDGDYGLTYSLLMMPSAVNDFNPYMITTPSGAIVLNSAYAAAAKAAGISKGGGSGTQEQRDKFIQAMVGQGLITQETANAITKIDGYDEEGAAIGDTKSVAWNPFAGVGAEPKNKSVIDAMRLPELAGSENFGQQKFDWSILTRTSKQISKIEYNNRINEYKTIRDYVQKEVNMDNVVSTLERYKKEYELENSTNRDEAYEKKIEEFDKYIGEAKKAANGEDFEKEDLLAFIDGLQKGFSEKYPENMRVEADANSFNFSGSSGIDANKLSVVINNVVCHNQGKVNDMTLGDLLTSDVVLVSNLKGKNVKEDMDKFKQQVEAIIDFLYDKLSVFDTDDASKDALAFALSMTKRQFLREIDIGSNKSNSLVDNSAYQNAYKNNAIGTDKDGDFIAVSLSNILSSFLTYYDNGLNMADSDYVVGKSVEQSVYVTDNMNYYYLFQNDSSAVTKIAEKSADFYDELYNNILAHGWREDAAIDDSEYLESMIKDGRYSMSSLNVDGFYYQTRYNETGYIVEVTDTDAIARAEAEFAAKKAELTYKEDAIDLKTKKLDVEISALTQEYESVKNLISNSIQKVFQQFQ